MKIKAICTLCGAEYWKKNGKSKYCSEECRKKAMLKKQKEWKEKNPNYFREYHANRKADTE